MSRPSPRSRPTWWPWRGSSPGPSRGGEERRPARTPADVDVARQKLAIVHGVRAFARLYHGAALADALVVRFDAAGRVDVIRRAPGE